MDRANCMPRGKVADLEREHQRIVHLERIKKIKNRKPGEGTLDNTQPEVIPAMKSNPRKKALAKEFNNTTLQENKSLLQRISKILTAPPKITFLPRLRQIDACRLLQEWIVNTNLPMMMIMMTITLYQRH